MKKLLLIIALCLEATKPNANPLPGSISHLSAFYFDENQQWKIELALDPIIPDSILISSSSGRSLFIGKNFYPLILTKDSLKSDVSINPAGDSVSIIYYSPWLFVPDSLVETFVFGSYRNATLPGLSKGQLITGIWFDNSLEIYHIVRGTSGSTKGILQGSIYDKENNLITSGSFNLSPFPIFILCEEGSYQTDGIDIKADGTYSTSLYTVKYEIGTIQICTLEMGGMGCQIYRPAGTLKIDSVEFIMSPDTTIERDIYLKEDFVGIKRAGPDKTSVVQIFPNPVINYCLHYQISIPVKSTQCFFELINAKGQVIWCNLIENNEGEITLRSDIPEGLYYLYLRSKERIYCSSPLVIKKQ